MRQFLLISTLMIFVVPTRGQTRVDRPIQFQLNFSGLLLEVFGNSIADETVDQLTVNSWLPGLSAGYHLNKFLYFGYSMYGPLNMTLEEEWGLTQNLDAYISLDHRTGPIHTFEVRFTPFKPGFFLLGGLANVGKVKYDMVFNRLDDAILIGSNNYNTDLNIKWNSENITRLALGIGYSHLTQSGLSFTLGLKFPAGFPDDENIRLIPTSAGVNILASDLQAAEARIQDETFYGPVMFMLEIGYNFKDFPR